MVIVQVNEYPPGVGLSPHIDTHSAFEGSIFSLSLAGPCIMEFRRYLEGAWLANATSSIDMKDKNLDNCTSFSRRAIYMPPRSMLLLSGEGRYAWHHYIPHHKVFSLLFICSLITFTFFFSVKRRSRVCICRSLFFLHKLWFIIFLLLLLLYFYCIAEFIVKFVKLAFANLGNLYYSTMH